MQKFHKIIPSLYLGIFTVLFLNNGTFTYIDQYINNYIRWIIFIIWFILASIVNVGFINKLIKATWPLILFLLYIFLLYQFNKRSLNNLFFQLIYLFMTISLAVYYIDQPIILKKQIIYFFCIDTFIVSIRTLLLLSKDSSISRTLAGSGKIRLLENATFNAVGSYSFFYSLVGLTIILLAFYLFNKNTKRFYNLLIIVILILSIIMSNFIYASLLLFIFILILNIIKYRNKFIINLCIIFILVFSLFNIQKILLYIIYNNNLPQHIINKAIDLFAFLFPNINTYYSNTLSSSFSRVSIYRETFLAFIYNPIIGTIFNPSSKYFGRDHTSWPDLLSAFGLVSFLFFIFLYRYYLYIKTKILFKNYIYFNVFWLYFLLLGFINPIFGSQIYLTWFFIVPLILTLYNINNNK